MIVIFWLAALTACSGMAQSRSKAGSEGALAQVLGTWRGNSVCMVKDSPCHDEVNVYRFAEIAGKSKAVMVTGSKVVDGKEVVMGTSEWKYEAEKQTLEWEGPHGTFRLSVGGDKMEGSLTTKDGVVYRRISLKKEGSGSV